MKDFLGTEIEVGDDIVVIQRIRSSYHLVKTKVVKLTPAHVIYETDNKYAINKVYASKVIVTSHCHTYNNLDGN